MVLTLNQSPHKKKSVCVMTHTCSPSTGEAERDRYLSLAGQSSLLGEFQDSKRFCFQKAKWTVPLIQHARVPSGFHMHEWTHVTLHTHHTQKHT